MKLIHPLFILTILLVSGCVATLNTTYGETEIKIGRFLKVAIKQDEALVSNAESIWFSTQLHLKESLQKKPEEDLNKKEKVLLISDPLPFNKRVFDRNLRKLRKKVSKGIEQEKIKLESVESRNYLQDSLINIELHEIIIPYSDFSMWKFLIGTFLTPIPGAGLAYGAVYRAGSVNFSLALKVCGKSITILKKHAVQADSKSKLYEEMIRVIKFNIQKVLSNEQHEVTQSMLSNQACQI